MTSPQLSAATIPEVRRQLSDANEGINRYAGEEVQRWAGEKAKVVKAFNTIGAHLFLDPKYGNEKADLCKTLPSPLPEIRNGLPFSLLVTVL